MGPLWAAHEMGVERDPGEHSALPAKPDRAKTTPRCPPFRCCGPKALANAPFPRTEGACLGRFVPVSGKMGGTFQIAEQDAESYIQQCSDGIPPLPTIPIPPPPPRVSHFSQDVAVSHKQVPKMIQNGTLANGNMD